MVENLVKSNNYCTFAAVFEKNISFEHGGIAQLVRAHDS